MFQKLIGIKEYNYWPMVFIQKWNFLFEWENYIYILEAERQRKPKEVRRKLNHSSQRGQAWDNCKLSEDRDFLLFFIGYVPVVSRHSTAYDSRLQMVPKRELNMHVTITFLVTGKIPLDAVFQPLLPPSFFFFFFFTL